jgi:hypothetical protein
MFLPVNNKTWAQFPSMHLFFGVDWQFQFEDLSQFEDFSQFDGGGRLTLPNTRQFDQFFYSATSHDPSNATSVGLISQCEHFDRAR